MNATEILHNGEGTGIWRCGTCGQYHKAVTCQGKPVSDMNRKAAERCCVCGTCNAPITEENRQLGYHHTCRVCLKKEREKDQEERRRMIESGENIRICENCGAKYDIFGEDHEAEDCIAVLRERMEKLQEELRELRNG